MSVVALSVFGKNLGTHRQSQVALLILLLCIVVEILGEPFRETTSAHSILRKLEVGALLVVWTTMWCGLMIYQSDLESEPVKELMTVFVILANSALMLWFLSALFRAKMKERSKTQNGRSLIKFIKRQKTSGNMAFETTKDICEKELTIVVNPLQKNQTRE